MDNKKIITELYYYYQKILIPFNRKQLKEYTFEALKMQSSFIFYNNKNNKLQLYATPFYECLYDGVCIDKIDDSSGITKQLIHDIIPIEITGNEKKDVKAYFQLCDKYL